MNKTNLLMAGLLLGSASALAQNTPVSQMEKLDRGVVALPASGGGNFVSWRFLGTDDENLTTFDIIRNGAVVKRDAYETNYTDKTGSSTSAYQIVTKISGEAVDTTEAVTAWGKVYKALTLDRPADGRTASGSYTYSPNDMSVGDVDGDGEYELFVKWDPSNSKDNSQDGYTGNVIIDCYKMDGKKLWRIDLGVNIRAGAHYTQFMVYDFDGDGKAELICKTAPGSKDSKGTYVNQATTDEKIKAADNTKSWLSSSGRMNGGHEYLTVFNGLTGEAIHTIAYNPNRNASSTLSEAAGTFNWGINGKNDTGGYNRGDRYLAAVAYLDGPDKNPSGIFCRGYYSYAFIWAVDFDGKQLKPKWLSSHRTSSSYTLTTYDADGNGTSQSFSGLKPTSGSGSATMFCNGNHNMSVADVDGDGCDEILWGSAALNNDGTLLYGTGFGHGDAIHVSDLDPTRPGLEVFQVHEEGGPYAWDVHDARTGEILLKGGPAGVDNGRGMAAQLDADHYGFYFSSASAREQRSAVTGEVASTGQTSLNFRIYWDGDLQDELLDGNKIDKWNGNGTSRVYINGKDLYNQGGPSSTCNSTKNTPNLQADILGDWREEIILHNGADQIAIYTTNTETSYRMPTLMHDHVYRMGVAWQNTAYNQPPHLGYYLPDAMKPQFIGEKELTVKPGEDIDWTLQGRYTKAITLVASYLPDGTRKPMVAPTGLTRKIDTVSKKINFTGSLDEVGDYKIEMKLTELNGDGSVIEMLTIHVDDGTGIENAVSGQATDCVVYDIQGRQRNEMKRGLNIVREGGKVKKVMAQ